MNYSKSESGRLINKIQSKYEEIYASVQDSSIFCFYQKQDDNIWIKACYFDRENGFGKYNIEAKETWVNMFKEMGGKVWELKFLFNYQLFRTVRQVHGESVAEQVYEPYLDGIQNAAQFSYSEGIEATTPNIPWKPWGSEFKFPLGAFF